MLMFTVLFASFCEYCLKPEATNTGFDCALLASFHEGCVKLQVTNMDSALLVCFHEEFWNPKSQIPASLYCMLFANFHDKCPKPQTTNIDLDLCYLKFSWRMSETPSHQGWSLQCFEWKFFCRMSESPGHQCWGLLCGVHNFSSRMSGKSPMLIFASFYEIWLKPPSHQCLSTQCVVCVQVHERCLKLQVNNVVLCYVLFKVFMKNVWNPKLPVDYIGLHLFDDDTSYRTY